MTLIFNQIVVFLAAYIVLEVIASMAFEFLKKKFSIPTNSKKFSSLKGMLERLVLYLGLVLGYPTVLIFFGAIKIATRLKEDDKAITNDYFLVGNLVSVLLVFMAISLHNLLLIKLITTIE